MISYLIKYSLLLITILLSFFGIIDISSAATRYWDGGGADNYWSTAANWSSDTVPTSADDVVFSATSTKDSVWNSAGPSTILSLNASSTYTGTLSITRGDTVTLNGGNWTYDAANFDAGTSTLKFNGGDPITFTPGSVSYYNIEALPSACCGGDFIISGTATATNNFVVSDGSASSYLWSGTINVGGNVSMTDTNLANDGDPSGNSMTINLNGSGSQTIYSNGGYFPTITINKPSGTLYLQGTIPVMRNWTFSSGTLDAGTSTLKFVGNTDTAFTGGSGSYYNIETAKLGCCGAYSLTISGTATTTNNFIVSAGRSDSGINSGILNIGGNIIITDTDIGTGSSGGTATTTLNGSGNQSIYSAGGFLPNLSINKTAGSSTIDSNVRIGRTLSVTNGELRHTTTTLQIDGTTLISSGGVFSDYSATGTVKFGSTITNSGTINFNGGGSSCGDADYISLRSTSDGTQRSWSGTGTFNMQDVDMKDMGSTSGGVTVRSGTNSGNNGGSWTFNSNCLPSASFDNDFSTWASSTILVNYNLIDPESDSSNISQSANSGVEYSTDGTTWSDATQGTGGDGMTALTSASSTGINHVFSWDSAADLPATEDSSVYLRLRPNDGTENASGWATSSAFALDNVAPSSVGVPTFGTIATSSIVINKPATVTESGSGLNTWQVRRNSSSALTAVATTTSSVTDSSLLENTQYTYDVRFTDNVGNISSYGATSTKYTLVDTPTNLSASSVGQTSIILTVDSFTNDTASSSGYYFERTGVNSGWIQTNSWTDSGLTCGNSYSYTVKYRNADGTETSTVSLNQTTSACDVVVSSGGGGLPISAFNSPSSPSEGLRIIINNNAGKTGSRIVNLQFNAGSDIKNMAISNYPDMKDAFQEEYQSIKQWDICSKIGGFIKLSNEQCVFGNHAVYVKFYTKWGQPSNIISKTIFYDKSFPIVIFAPTSSLSSAVFTGPLYRGLKNNDVKRLQIFLSTDKEIYPEALVTGYFGPLTEKAVQKFQMKYKIVSSENDPGYGYVGPKTRAKLKEVFG